MIKRLTGFGVIIAFGVVLAQANAQTEKSTKSAELPAELADFTAKYEGAIEKAEAPLSQLKSGYLAKLVELKDTEQAAGNLENVLMVTKEIERLKTNEPGRNSKLGELASLQGIYHRHAESTAPRVYLENIRIEEAYLQGLNEMIVTYTRRGQLKEALAARELLSKSKERVRKWNRLASVGSSNHDPFAFFDWKKLGEKIRANELTRSESFGGVSQNNDTTRDLPAEPSLLIGFDLYLAPFGGSRETVRKIIPLYRTEKELIVEGIPRATARGQKKRRVVGKKGYVLSGASSHSESGIRKVKFEFQRLNGMRTDPSDSYETEWYGEWDGGRIASFTTNQMLPVGVDGWVGLGTSETWFILVKP